MQTGADEEKVREVPTWRESARFSPMERAALEYAEAMTITGQRVSDELFARVRSFFDEAQVVELSAAVALENFRSKLNVPLGIEAQGFCVIPERQNPADGGSPRTDSATQAQPENPTPRA
jgi:alkylhydroperoxidase family enzyme